MNIYLKIALIWNIATTILSKMLRWTDNVCEFWVCFTTLYVTNNVGLLKIKFEIFQFLYSQKF